MSNPASVAGPRLTAASTVTANQGAPNAGGALSWPVRLSDGAAFYVGAQTGQFPAALVGGRLDVNVGASVLPTGAATEATLATLLTLAGFQARINTLGQKAMAASTPVVIASDQSAVPVSGTVTANPTQPTAAATTSVAAAGVDTVLLAANANRKGASVWNDSATATLLLKFGAGASAASFKVSISPGTGYELPYPVYTGAVNGFWTGAIAGSARISEET